MALEPKSENVQLLVGLDNRSFGRSDGFSLDSFYQDTQHSNTNPIPKTHNNTPCLIIDTHVETSQPEKIWNFHRDALFNATVPNCLGPCMEDKALIQGLTTEQQIFSSLTGQMGIWQVWILSSLQPHLTKHSEVCRRVGILFFPLPMEALGRRHGQTVCQVERMGSIDISVYGCLVIQ